MKKKKVDTGPALRRAVSALSFAGVQVKHIEFRLDGTFIVVPLQQVDHDHVFSGAAAVARAMGVSAQTVRRMVSDGRLKALQTGNATSPIKVRQSEINRIMQVPPSEVAAFENACARLS